eukprot:g5329.t1
MPGLDLSAAVTALIRATRPVFTSRRDRVVYAVHTYHLCQGYTLVGLGGAEESELAPEDATEISLDGWNNSQELYIFKYKDETKQLLPVIVKCISIENTLVICVTSIGPEDEEPRTMNVNVNDVTTDSMELIQGYQSLDNLVGQFVEHLGAFPKEKKDTETENPPGGAPPPPANQPRSTLIEESRITPPPRLGVIGGGYDMNPPPILDAFGGARGGGGSLVGLGDPRFRSSLRHPELQPGIGGMRYDPIAPPGVRGYRPGDFLPGNEWDMSGPPYHPDVGPPGPGRGPDFDHMYG